MESVAVGNRLIGPGQPCFVIAEAGVNHNGDVVMAERLIDVAVAARADAVKFQTFHARALTSAGAPKAQYQLRTTGAAESQFEMLSRLELSKADHQRLKRHCERRGILFLSTPFDTESADFLSELGVPAFKISSGEVTNLPFLDYIARKRRPVILSTGMSYLDEVQAAVETILDASNNDIILLHCVSNYPADPVDVNLRAMLSMAKATGKLTGYSDHTLGFEVAYAAVALGACVVEKHFTLDRDLPGPDHSASLEPDELAQMVNGIRVVESALGSTSKAPAASEFENRSIVRRSVAACKDIPVGITITKDCLTSLRPATGIEPARLNQIVGRRSKRTIAAGQLIDWGDLD